MKSSQNSFYHRNRKKIWLVSFIGLLIAIRLALPYIILHYLNKELAGLKGYYGHVADLDLAIYRGAYKVHHMYLNMADSVTLKQTPFLDIDETDLSVEWKALFKGRIVGELYVIRPQVLFTLDKVEPKDVQKDSATLRDLLDKMMPLKINRFEITHGRLRYKDQTSKPPVDISMTDIYVLAQNLSNVVDSNHLLPGSVYAEADLYQGNLVFNMKINPLRDHPTFDLNAELKNTSLPLLNEFFQAYGKFDVNRGTLGLYTEFAAKDGKYEGYVKPLIKDLDVLGKEDRKDSFLHKLWEGAVGTVGEVFENQKKNQFATKVEIKGSFKEQQVSTWDAIIEVLRNAFVHALEPAVDNQINISSVDNPEPVKKRTFLQKIFTKKEDKK